MKEIEECSGTLPPGSDTSLHFAALAGLGSKYLAVGSPASLAVVGCGADRDSIIACHELLFGYLDILHGDQLGIEEAVAADIVCLPTSTEFDLEWIADATHLNVLDDGQWSEGMKQLARHCSVTYTGRDLPAQGHAHGLLADVVRGSVSGRMGEEVTVLVCKTGRPLA